MRLQVRVVHKHVGHGDVRAAIQRMRELVVAGAAALAQLARLEARARVGVGAVAPDGHHEARARVHHGARAHGCGRRVCCVQAVQAEQEAAEAAVVAPAAHGEKRREAAEAQNAVAAGMVGHPVRVAGLRERRRVGGVNFLRHLDRVACERQVGQRQRQPQRVVGPQHRGRAQRLLAPVHLLEAALARGGVGVEVVERAHKARLLRGQGLCRRQRAPRGRAHVECRREVRRRDRVGPRARRGRALARAAGSRALRAAVARELPLGGERGALAPRALAQAGGAGARAEQRPLTASAALRLAVGVVGRQGHAWGADLLVVVDVVEAGLGRRGPVGRSVGEHRWRGARRSHGPFGERKGRQLRLRLRQHGLAEENAGYGRLRRREIRVAAPVTGARACAAQI